MLSQHEELWDSRGQSLPLRPDPEGVWKERGSFRLQMGTSHRRFRKHPRVMFVLAMRELQGLDMRPDTRAAEMWVWIMWIVYSMGFAALIYGTILKDFFGPWNWPAIGITFVAMALIYVVWQWWSWRRSDAKYDELCAVLDTNPPHCAACWYPLGDQVEDDGCVVCPECGGAWMVHSSHGTAAQV